MVAVTAPLALCPASSICLCPERAWLVGIALETEIGVEVAWKERMCFGDPGVSVSSFLPSPGPSLSCFHWPRGVQACARLQQFLEWARSSGLGAPAERFFRKLSCTLHLLATPSAQLVQVGGH